LREPSYKFIELTKIQERSFRRLANKLIDWVKEQRPEDYHVFEEDDGLFLGDLRARRIEFTKGKLSYDVVVTVRRTDGKDQDGNEEG